MSSHDELLIRVEEASAPILSALGFRLIEREFVCEHGQWILRLYMEKAGGAVTIDDCERASLALGDALDIAEVLRRSYRLEVSSPGIERPLRYPEDFMRFRGSRISMKTRYPIEGRSHFKGLLEHWDNGVIFIAVEGHRFQIPHTALAKAKLVDHPIGVEKNQH